MAERPDYTNLTATQPAETYSLVNASQTAPIGGSGGTETIHVYSPSGTISRVQAAQLQVLAVPGATSGSQQIYAQAPGGPVYVSGTAPYDGEAYYDGGTWIQAANDAIPTASQSQSYWLGRMLFDSVAGMEFGYANNSNATQTGGRLYVLGVMVVETP